MKPTTVIFDLDGTLVDSARDLMATLNHILAREGCPPLAVEKAGSLLGAGARALIERGFALEGKALTTDRMETLYHEFLVHYGEHLADKTVAFDGVTEALETLQSRGFILGICTNKMTDHSIRLVNALGLSQYFSAICGRDAFAWCKPDARHLTGTIARAQGDCRRAIMVGDSRTDVAAANNAGIACICVDFGYTDVPAAQLGAARVISHFRELVPAIDDLTIKAEFAAGS